MRQPNRFIQALHSITAWLEREKLPYMVFGGVANSLYGNPRQTFDIDIKVILPPETRLDALLDSLRQEAEILPEDPGAFLNETNVLPVEVKGVRVDMVLGSLPFEVEAVQRSRAMDVYGRDVRVCLPEDLVIQKAVSSREKDWMDIHEIIRLQAKAMDRDYLLRHCKELSDLLSDPDIYNRIKEWLDAEPL